MTHKDYLAVDKMSNSRLSAFAKNPSTYLDPFETTDAMRLGTAVDALFYNPIAFRNNYSVLNWDDRPAPKFDKGKLNLEWLEDQRTGAAINNLEIITSDDMETVQQICDNLKSDETIREMLAASDVHRVFYGEINGVEMKCEIDNVYVIGGNYVLCDLKTIHSMDKFIGRARYELNYRMMPFVYTELMSKNDMVVDRVEFLVSDTSTFDYQVFICSDEYLEASKELVFKYLDLYKEALRTNNFSHRVFGDQYIYPIGS